MKIRSQQKQKHTEDRAGRLRVNYFPDESWLRNFLRIFLRVTRASMKFRNTTRETYSRCDRAARTEVCSARTQLRTVKGSWRHQHDNAPPRLAPPLVATLLVLLTLANIYVCLLHSLTTWHLAIWLNIFVPPEYARLVLSFCIEHVLLCDFINFEQRTKWYANDLNTPLSVLCGVIFTPMQLWETRQKCVICLYSRAKMLAVVTVTSEKNKRS